MDNDNNYGDQDKVGDMVGDDSAYISLMEQPPEEIKKWQFESECDGISFYKRYAKWHGFVIRKDDVERDGSGSIIMRHLVCNKAGERDEKYMEKVDRCKDHRPLSRTNCPARMRLRLDYKTGKWKVTSFFNAHNHEMTPLKYMHLHSGNRGLTESDKAQVDSLHYQGVRTCHIMGYMVAQKGGFSRLGFVDKDLYNHLDGQKRSRMKDGDAYAALTYLQAKADHDPLMFSKYTTTEDGKLGHLFWADGDSRLDFQCFGDVLAFDATYKKNKYNKPLIIFSGLNHHSRTVIFASALVSDETTKTYRWVLETFLEAMCGKHPIAVVTDGDGAMREAIKSVFSNASHRLCAWHLFNNACDNVRRPEFLKDFNNLLYANVSPMEFEDRWRLMVANHGVEEHKWVLKAYENRFHWAHAYLRDQFFGRLRTTSRCEGINSMIKAYVKKKNTLVDFLHKYEQALRVYRNNELTADFKSLFTVPVLTTFLRILEKHAAEVFTQDLFKQVKTQIEEVGGLNVIEEISSGDTFILKVNAFSNRDTQFSVIYDKTLSQFLCDCRLFESCGVPCSHIFCALRHRQLDSIPRSLILKRWTKTAKSNYISLDPSEDLNTERMMMARVGALSSACNKLCHLAAKNSVHYNEVLNEIMKLTNKIQSKEHSQHVHRDGVKVGDPPVVKTKGAPSKKKYGRKRRCSNCNQIGHTIRTCPRLVDKSDDLTIEEDELTMNDDSSSSSSDANGTDIDSYSKRMPANKNKSPAADCRKTEYSKRMPANKNKSPAADCRKTENKEVNATRATRTNTENENCSTSNSINKQNEEANQGCRMHKNKATFSTPSSAKDQKFPLEHSNSKENQENVLNSSSFMPPNELSSQGVQGLHSIPHIQQHVAYPQHMPQIPQFPMYPQIPQHMPHIAHVQMYPQVPQYLAGLQNTGGPSSFRNLMMQVSKNCDPSGKT